MGLFSGIKSTYKKSEAAIVVQNLLEQQAKVGIFDLDPARFAKKLIEIIWNSKPDVFDGKFGQRPHKLAVAASALSNGIALFEVGSLNRGAVILSLGNIISEVETNGGHYPLNSLDHHLLENSILVFAKATQEYSELPLKNEIDPHSHDVIARAARMLEMQLLLCKADDKTYDGFLHSKFVRGYIFGFFDAAMQRANIPLDSDDQFYLLLAAGHTYIFDGNTEQATNYVYNSLALQGDQEFDQAQGQGGTEYFDFLDGKIRNPIWLMEYFHGERSADA
ncbi:hypothetical protein [Pseudomonas sp. GM55]|uniref:hypothetical protein n=1 Tax=Pseudomonas sp. GM55 TaxID=1144333 RepID=UPI000270D5D4|nr:hypothetical protein [Pseudomonas sp. GM55]EJM69954.1 hypothetical protein PMI31_04520 [Pseudomonas sp. GM55]